MYITMRIQNRQVNRFLLTLRVPKILVLPGEFFVVGMIISSKMGEESRK